MSWVIIVLRVYEYFIDELNARSVASALVDSRYANRIGIPIGKYALVAVRTLVGSGGERTFHVNCGGAEGGGGREPGSLKRKKQKEGMEINEEYVGGIGEVELAV